MLLASTDNGNLPKTLRWLWLIASSDDQEEQNAEL